jgi:hypothetical protein
MLILKHFPFTPEVQDKNFDVKYIYNILIYSLEIFLVLAYTLQFLGSLDLIFLKVHNYNGM